MKKSILFMILIVLFTSLVYSFEKSVEFIYNPGEDTRLGEKLMIIM